MFVYKKDTLERSISALTTEIGEAVLKHKPTGVTLSYEFNIEPDAKPRKITQDNKPFNIVSPYLIYKLNEQNKYEFKEDVWDEKKSLLDNFKDAVAFFESKIFEELKEEEPKPEPPKPPRIVSQLPQIGDLVRIGNDRFGVVTDVDEESRNIVFDEKTNEEIEVIKTEMKKGFEDGDFMAQNKTVLESIFGEIKD